MAGQVLVQQQYVQHGKVARGLVRRYIEKMSGLSSAQVMRWSHATQLPAGSVQQSIGGAVAQVH